MFCLNSTLDHPDLVPIDERLDYLLTKNLDAKARLTEISVNDLIWLLAIKRQIVMDALIVETI